MYRRGILLILNYNCQEKKQQEKSLDLNDEHDNLYRPTASIE